VERRVGDRVKGRMIRRNLRGRISGPPTQHRTGPGGSMTEQPEDEVHDGSEESNRRKTSPEEHRVSVYAEHAEHRNSQSVEKEGQVRVELASLCTLDVVVNPLQEGRTCERGDHDHVRSNPCQDDIRPGIAVAVRLLRSSVSRFLLGRWRLLEGVLGSSPKCVDVFLHSWQVDGHHFLTILALHLRGTAKVLGSTVVALGTPRNIVQVAHSVHHQNVYVCKRDSVISGLGMEGTHRRAAKTCTE
jgi:hypothetical protein